MVAIQKKQHINSPIGCRSTQLVCTRYIAMAVALLYAVIMIVLLLRSNNNMIVDNRKLHTTSTDDFSPSSNHQYASIIVKEIITKWNITTPNAAYLLEQQFYTSNNNDNNEYNPQLDFLHFPHIPKTGGTSISDLLRDIFGSDHVLPGSARSAPFNYDALNNIINLSSTQITKDDNDDPLQRSNSYLVSYAHTRLRPTHGPNRTRFASFLQQRIINGGRRSKKKKRRIRLLQMLREPMDLRASTHAMAMCGINGQVKAFNEEISSSSNKEEGRLKKSKKYKPKCTPEEGLNISALWDNVVWKAMSKCSSRHFNNTTTTTTNNANTTTTTTIRFDRFDKILCKRGPSALDICRSPTTLLSSPQYKIGMRSLLLDLMGRFVGNEQMGRYTDHYYLHHSSLNSTTTSSKEEMSDGRGVGFTIMKTEEYTLIDLGGLDVNNIMYTPYYRGYDIASVRRRTTKQKKTTIQQQQQSSISSANTINNNYQAEPDILWFGISERMTESICLLYYTLKVKPLPQIPTQRVMTCPTTGWWTETDRKLVKQMEQADYAVWRVANAILDVRLIRMKNDIQYKLDNEDELLLTKEEKELNRALVEAGCLSL